MKKVLVLLVAMLLVATGAMATIVGSKHDLTSATGTGSIKDTGTNQEVCVYCHTPHKATIGVGVNAPLWNRSLTGVTPNDFYNSATIETLTQPNVVDERVIASDAQLCLSCHSGTTLASPLNNPPNSGTTNETAFASLSGNLNIGVDLSNDHPIGMDYAAVQGLDAGLQPLPATLDFFTYGAVSNVMWCSTCHDVHDGTYPPFLATSNAASALCLDCHIK